MEPELLTPLALLLAVSSGSPASEVTWKEPRDAFPARSLFREATERQRGNEDKSASPIMEARKCVLTVPQEPAYFVEGMPRENCFRFN